MQIQYNVCIFSGYNTGSKTMHTVNSPLSVQDSFRGLLPQGKNAKCGQEEMHCVQISDEISAVCNLWNSFAALKHWEMWRLPWNQAVPSVKFLFLRKGYPSINRAFHFSDSFCLSAIYVARGCHSWWTSGLRWLPLVPASQVSPGPDSGKAEHVFLIARTHTLLTWLATQINKERKRNICLVTYVLSECLVPFQILWQAVKTKGLLDHQQGLGLMSKLWTVILNSLLNSWVILSSRSSNNASVSTDI